jgi:hypothetical protein
MPKAGFETVIPEVERPQTYASDLAASGTDLLLYIKPKPKFNCDKKNGVITNLRSMFDLL